MQSMKEKTADEMEDRKNKIQILADRIMSILPLIDGFMESMEDEDFELLENMNDGYTFKDCDMCNNYNEKTKCCNKHKCMELQAIEHILLDYKKLQEEFKQIDHECERLEEKEVRIIKENEYYKDLINALETYYNITREDLEKCMKNDR